MRLLLIRHAQTPSNVVGALDTAFPGAGLTALGQVQSRAVPAALLEERISAVYASRLVRTQLTAAPLGRDRTLQVTVRPGLEEISAGAFEMREDDEAVRGYTEPLIAWFRGDLTAAVPGGEDGHTFLGRFDDALRRIAADHGSDETVAVFSHGAAIRSYTSLRAGLDADRAADLRIMNTGMGILEGDPDRGFELLRWQTEPLGGLRLEDELADDPTGESAEEATEGGSAQSSPSR